MEHAQLFLEVCVLVHVRSHRRSGFSSLGSLLSSPVRERARNDAWSISALLISRKNLFFSNQSKHDRLDSGWLREPRRDRLSHHWQSPVIPLILPQVPVHYYYITNVS